MGARLGIKSSLDSLFSTCNNVANSQRWAYLFIVCYTDCAITVKFSRNYMLTGVPMAPMMAESQSETALVDIASGITGAEVHYAYIIHMSWWQKGQFKKNLHKYIFSPNILHVMDQKCFMFSGSSKHADTTVTSCSSCQQLTCDRSDLSAVILSSLLRSNRF